MSMDKKHYSGADSSSSNSSLPLFSPLVDKSEGSPLDFSAAAIAFPSCELLETELLDHGFQSLHLITNQSLTCREAHEEEPHSLQLKEEKVNSFGRSLECTPVLGKQKVQLGEEVFEVPQLTAESLISSEDIDLDSEGNLNDLPLCSTRRHKIDRVFHEQSEGSDEYEDRSKAYLAKQNYAESKGSDRSESDDFPSICKLCYVLVEKSKVLELEKVELVKEAQLAKEELVRVQEKNRRMVEQREELLHAESLPPLLLKEHFLSQIQEMKKTLSKVNEFLAAYAFDFRGKECELLQRFSLEFKKLEEETLGRVEKESKRRDLEQLHSSYKKIISKLIKDFEEREAKKDVDFRRFVTAVARRPPPEPPRSFEGKSERSRRKSKTYAEKEDNMEMELLDHNRQWQQSRQRVEWLEMALTRERESGQQQERTLTQRCHRLQAQIADLTNERNTYRSLAGKYSQEFAEFMLRLAQQQSSSLTQSDFFRTLSQRVFEISNCIPFEDNDEQNLFAPESEEELFEMLDRVRRFYQRIEDYNMQRDSEFEAEKGSFTRFFKELVEQNRVTPRLLLETLEGNGYSSLGYLKELIRSSKLPEREHAVPGRESIGNRILKIERAKSFTISSHGILDHN